MKHIIHDDPPPSPGPELVIAPRPSAERIAALERVAEAGADARLVDCGHNYVPDCPTCRFRGALRWLEEVGHGR